MEQGLRLHRTPYYPPNVSSLHPRIFSAWRLLIKPKWMEPGARLKRLVPKKQRSFGSVMIMSAPSSTQ
jgi:hypothetical protein